MDPRSRKAKEIALRNIEQIDILINLIKKKVQSPKIPEKPKEVIVDDFYRVKEVD